MPEKTKLQHEKLIQINSTVKLNTVQLKETKKQRLKTFCENYLSGF